MQKDTATQLVSGNLSEEGKELLGDLFEDGRLPLLSPIPEDLSYLGFQGKYYRLPLQVFCKCCLPRVIEKATQIYCRDPEKFSLFLDTIRFIPIKEEWIGTIKSNQSM